MSRPVVLSIGTTHPWNVAGLGLDLMVGEEFGVRVLSVTTAVSAQDAEGVKALHGVPPEIVQAQLATVPWDAVRAIRVGALPTAFAVRELVAVLDEHPAIPAVVDPVLAATLGGQLGEDGVLPVLRDEVGTRPNVILTPNAHEAALLLGTQELTRDTIVDAARILCDRGARAVLIKGGHIEGDPVDVLASGEGMDRYVDERLPGSMRGTGCTLAMALASELARGLKLLDAVRSARAFVRGKIASGTCFAGLNVAY